MKNLTNETFHAMKNQVRTKLVLRFLVVLYILYLVKGIIEIAIKGTSSMPTWVTLLISTVFILFSAAFGLYAWRQYKISLVNMEKEDDESCQEELKDDN